YDTHLYVRDNLNRDTVHPTDLCSYDLGIPVHSFHPPALIDASPPNPSLVHTPTFAKRLPHIPRIPRPLHSCNSSPNRRPRPCDERSSDPLPPAAAHHSFSRS